MAVAPRIMDIIQAGADFASSRSISQKARFKMDQETLALLLILLIVIEAKK